MPYCVPIKDLKDTAAFAKMVKETDHPIFVTKNGREEFVVMSTGVYHEETVDPARRRFYAFLERSQADADAGRVMDAFEFLQQMVEEDESCSESASIGSDCRTMSERSSG